MDSPTLISRRKFLAASGALTAAVAGAAGLRAAPTEAAPRAGAAGVSRQSLDTGERAPRAGPVTVLPDGTVLWATTEPEAPYIAEAMWAISRVTLRRSSDGGASWGPPQHIVRGAREYSVLSHALKVTASGALLHVFVRYSGYDYATHTLEKSHCQAFFHRSHDGGRTWSEPAKLPTGEQYIGDVLSLEQLRDGRLVYPFAFLTAVKEQFACSAMYSDDDGLSWRRSPSVLVAGGGGFESGASEPTTVELPDGRLWMLIRAQTGFLWESFSSDRGQSWSPAVPTKLPSSNAPSTMLRLKSGEIAMAWDNDLRSNYARQSLVVGLTRDGRAFSGLRELDFTDFADNPAEPPQHVTYPYLAEARDGTLLISYNKGTWSRHNRPTFARVGRGWLTARQEGVDFRDGRVGWHTVNPGPNGMAAVETYMAPAGLEGLWLQLEQARGHRPPAGVTRNLPLVSDGEVRVTLQVVRPEASLIFGYSLLEPQNITEGCLRLRWTGDQVLLAAGRPERVQRNNSMTQYSYLAQVFRAETPYPQPPSAGAAVEVAVAYRAASRTAEIRLNGGPAVTLQTEPILGLTHLALAVTGGGALRVRSVHTDLRANA